MKNQLTIIMTIAASLLTLAHGMKGRAAHAVTTTILQPVSVSSNVPPYNRVTTANNLIDRLSSSYVSGESDFSQITQNVTHDFSEDTIWVGMGETATLTFDLGDVFTIQGLALWNDLRLLAINQFKVFPDNDNNFENGKGDLLGTFNALKISFAVENFPAQTFSFEPTATRFVHLDIISSHELMKTGFAGK